MKGKHDIIDLPLGAGAKIDHFADVSKMVRGLMPADLAGYFGLGDHLSRISPLGISQNLPTYPQIPGGVFCL